MKQQELADKIGIHMQSLSKIERGVNYPTFDTLEKIMDVLGVTPNELLSGEWKYVNQAEKEVCQFLKIEERLNAELKRQSANWIWMVMRLVVWQSVKRMSRCITFWMLRCRNCHRINPFI